MPTLHAKEGGTLLGTISDEDVQFLIDQLEEEHAEDDDYYVDGATLELLEERGASIQLLDLLRAAVGESEGLDVQYRR